MPWSACSSRLSISRLLCPPAAGTPSSLGWIEFAPPATSAATASETTWIPSLPSTPSARTVSPSAGNLLPVGFILHAALPKTHGALTISGIEPIVEFPAPQPHDSREGGPCRPRIHTTDQEIAVGNIAPERTWVGIAVQFRSQNRLRR